MLKYNSVDKPHELKDITYCRSISAISEEPVLDMLEKACDRHLEEAES